MSAAPPTTEPPASTAALLEQHFNTAFAAPDGLKKLRELILTLAMQGKLVEQDPSDPPASELLKEIEQEKRRLVAAGKIKVPKPLPPIEADKVPYEVPEGWAWVRFGDIAQHNSGKTLDGGRNSGKLRPYITTSNLYWGRFNLENVRQMQIQDSELEKCTAIKDDLLICEGGEAGRAAVWSSEDEICFQNHIHRARFFRNVEPYYAYEFFEKLNATGEIEQYRKGVGISNMSSKALGSIAFPLPPLPEQQRIVAKIDELMARCDELEGLRAAQQQQRLDVHTAALSRLLGASEPQAFAQAWAFVAQHFGDLYSVSQNVAELRKAVLQLAVMGKLVPQDPSDPPASELLKEIEQEKHRLVAAGKIKAPKPLPPVKPEDRPYKVPDGWAWVRLGDIFDVRDGTHDTPKYVSEGFPLVTSKNLYTGVLSLDGAKYISEGDHKSISERSKVDKYDILFAMIGSIGNPVLVDTDTEFSIKNVALFKFYTNDRTHNHYLHLYLSHAQDDMKRISSGAVQSFVSLGFLRNYLFPLPPLPGQRRIVAKVDELMALCDELEARLSDQTGTQSALLASLMAAITPASTTSATRPRPARAASTASAEASAPTEPKRRGRPAKVASPATGRIPTANSEDDAIRQLEERKFQKAEGTRQDGLFD